MPFLKSNDQQHKHFSAFRCIRQIGSALRSSVPHAIFDSIIERVVDDPGGVVFVGRQRTFASLAKSPRHHPRRHFPDVLSVNCESDSAFDELLFAEESFSASFMIEMLGALAELYDIAGVLVPVEIPKLVRF